MTNQEVLQQNSYYVQTNRYEFCRYNQNGKTFIKIVNYEDNFSIILNGGS